MIAYRNLLLAAALLLAACLPTPGPAAPPPTVSSIPTTAPPMAWRTIVFAGETSEPVFENARRALTDIFRRDLGGEPEGFSPNPPAGEGARIATAASLAAALAQRPPTAGEGCLFYFTSHGTPDGLQLRAEKRSLSPADLARLLDRHCRARPTVVVVSACFSGVFLDPQLARGDRIVLTAARRDRSSFGCSPTEELNVYDRCFIENWPAAQSWGDLHDRLIGCIDRRERERGYAPPSEPQAYFGPGLRNLPPRG